MAFKKYIVTGLFVMFVMGTLPIFKPYVPKNNMCGNEDRNWDNLTFPKESYCSTPKWLPYRKEYEAQAKAPCKIHDNNRGIKGKELGMAAATAHKKFLCDLRKRTDLPLLVSYASYWWVSIFDKD